MAGAGTLAPLPVARGAGVLPAEEYWGKRRGAHRRGEAPPMTRNEGGPRRGYYWRIIWAFTAARSYCFAHVGTNERPRQRWGPNPPILIVLRMWAPMSGRDSGGGQMYGCQTTAHAPAKRGAPNDPNEAGCPQCPTMRVGHAGATSERIIWAFNSRQILIVLRMWAPMSSRDSGGGQIRQILIVLRMWAPMSSRDSGGRQMYGRQTTPHAPAKRDAPNDPQ
ncbi:hypothetical protein BU14_0207s0035 [Porphyra umbilicalis]|uniref:Uncharacterized protein n=1 Tax=Porphyra umbilicalis TaxID=2786 RepID=A0A1X6P5L0_PORUM|nr:hypothetical protein BU14_0207s0035 [Porphyra umbilicalis]|eukprot:OSX76117.1 hypothetical protein BU14_0207s0035 [Porphyra umbilicalis]